jgi:pyruvate dehydrogenase E1 component alpha subunit
VGPENALTKSGKTQKLEENSPGGEDEMARQVTGKSVTPVTGKANDAGPAIAREKVLDMYRTMVRIRTFEERVAKEFAAGRVVGFAHLYIGEEAVATGACANLRADDYIVSTHRGHGHIIAKGGKTDRMMAELFGKKTGYCEGKGGSMHIADPDIGILGANGIVGAGIPIAGGVGLSTKLRGTDQVVVCFFGDGANNTASFHEGVNLASAFKLPVVYVVENNLWAMSTRTTTCMNITDITVRAAAYGIPGVTVDGNDVLAVYDAVGQAVWRARQGGGPTLLVCQTYRRRGHSEGDPGAYKPKEEAAEWLKKDPIATARQRFVAMGILSQSQADSVEREMLEELDKAVQFAEQSPYPAPEETLENVFA